MKALHVTSEKAYRDPFGAALRGGAVTVGIDVWDDDITSCVLRLWSEEEGERLVEMEPLGTADTTNEDVPADATHYATTFVPEVCGVIWYSFLLTASNGDVWRYGAKPGRTCGEGDFAYGDPPSFQITVYKPREQQPEWYRNGVVYQIFPDRFARGTGWDERVKESLERHRTGPRRVLVADWDTPPSYRRTSDGRIAEWGFYGGSLEGIREHLDYLEALGVTVLYLNPIFEAASNHRYDTGDFMRVDSMLGDTESFKRLCDDARKRGISIILDGVFNHTGCDSRYFNKYRNYPGRGAWQGRSPYDTWYHLAEDGTYASWWDIDDLPDVDENDPSYQEFICGENGVVRTWLRAGAAGWRLDVADELPDEFIELIKEAALAEKPDALLLGEVWEDASHKYAYNKLRHYFQGTELDGVMNYPFRTGVLGFLTGKTTAQELVDTLEQLCENYPPDAFACNLNLLGSHDRERVLTVLGGAPDPDTLSDEERASYRLTKDQVGLAKGRLWAAALIQMTMPGVPCVYYGDERGLQGFRDPYNRATFPWDGGDMDCTAIYRNAIGIRKALPVLVNGDFRPFSPAEGVFGFWRCKGSERVCVLVNGSLEKACEVRVPLVAPKVVDVVSGRAPKVDEDECEVFLWPLGTAVLYFHDDDGLVAPIKRGMGVLAHVTSLPNSEHPNKPGTMASAKGFIGWLSAAGVRYWQILPINPCDEHGSPYAGLSAFAGNTALVEGLITGKVLRRAERQVREGCAFVRTYAAWLEPYAAFRAIKDLVGESVPWWEWPEQYRTYNKLLLADKDLLPGIQRHMAEQMLFDEEWQRVRGYASAHGVKIIGDMPMYVSRDSADVWANPDIFNPALLAGAPPDPLGPEGQLWGNPTFRWDVLEKRGFDWWLDRFERMFSLYDYVRLDHFIGFSSYYGIPQGKTALEGQWFFGPGKKLFKAAYDRFGPLPVIAEDLGSITPAVRALSAEVGAPGMSVIQFADEDVREGFHPAAGSCAFTATHDTQTIVGWCESHFALKGEKAVELAQELNARVLKSDCDLAVLQLQDILLLDNEARMNVPGTAEGNWSWRASQDQLDEASDYLAKLAALR